MAIRIKKDGTEQSGLVDDNVVQPFRLEKSNVRGRMVRLGSVLADMMRQHKYPPPVSALLSEVVTLCLLLSGMLKYEGIFTLQIKGNGPIRLLVADVTSRGEVRAYAGFDAAAVKKAAKRKKDTAHNHYHLLGKKGYIAFTVDQGSVDDRYQGIVELKGSSIVDAVQHYFTQSEQIKTSFSLAVHPQDAQWRTGAIMIQQLPDENAAKGGESNIEDWTRAVMLLSTCTDGEMLSPVLASADVLYRLFHEDGVRVYSPTHVRFKCRCSRPKVVSILRTIPRPELEDICEKEGHVSIKCEFCSEEYLFAKEQLDEVYEEKKS
ncbi:MAG: Hsp33 family molecular chaperone HslO [Alphaproteobacteria bacterium]|nr:MAG: Hsp33 family molecular chaperone HslO [Alphaproteobacteria bacterium]